MTLQHLRAYLVEMTHHTGKPVAVSHDEEQLHAHVLSGATGAQQVIAEAEGSKGRAASERRRVEQCDLERHWFAFRSLVAATCDRTKEPLEMVD
jgi:hypothetical protein